MRETPKAAELSTPGCEREVKELHEAARAADLEAHRVLIAVRKLYRGGEPAIGDVTDVRKSLEEAGGKSLEEAGGCSRKGAGHYTGRPEDEAWLRLKS